RYWQVHALAQRALRMISPNSTPVTARLPSSSSQSMQCLIVRQGERSMLTPLLGDLPVLLAVTAVRFDGVHLHQGGVERHFETANGTSIDTVCAWRIVAIGVGDVGAAGRTIPSKRHLRILFNPSHNKPLGRQQNRVSFSKAEHKQRRAD